MVSPPLDNPASASHHLVKRRHLGNRHSVKPRSANRPHQLQPVHPRSESLAQRHHLPRYQRRISKQVAGLVNHPDRLRRLLPKWLSSSSNNKPLQQDLVNHLQQPVSVSPHKQHRHSANFKSQQHHFVNHQRRQAPSEPLLSNNSNNLHLHHSVSLLLAGLANLLAHLQDLVNQPRPRPRLQLPHNQQEQAQHRLSVSILASSTPYPLSAVRPFATLLRSNFPCGRVSL